MNKKEIIVHHLKTTKDVPYIAKQANCKRSYVYIVAKRVGIKLPLRRQKLHAKHFSADKTLAEVAKEVGVSYQSARSYARHHDVPYRKREVVSDYVTEYVNNMTFLTIDQLRNVVDISRSQLSYVRQKGNPRGHYANKHVVRYLGEYGADATAEKFGLDDEILHNMMYVFDNRNCPYTNIDVDITNRMRSDIELGLRGEV